MASRIYPSKNCQLCSQGFAPTSPNQRYCVNCRRTRTNERQRGYVRRPQNSEADREYNRKYYAENKDRVKDQVRKRVKKRITLLRKYTDFIKSVPCMDCGGRFPPEVMEFDHIPERGKKELAISNMVALGFSFEKIQEEIKKCQVVCANCHRIRTVFRRTIKPL